MSDVKQETPAENPVNPVTSTPPADDSMKKIAELEKKLGELSSTLDEQNEFIKGASLVLNTVAYTPELKQSFQQHYQRLYGEGVGQQPPQNPPQNPPPGDKPGQTPVSDPRVNDLVSSSRENIVAQFEKEYGIRDLKEEDRKETRRKLESYLNEFGLSVQTAPLTTLRGNLEKAFVGTHAEKLREEGKLEGFVQARANANGVIGTFSGTAPQNEPGKKVLSDAQLKWVNKMGLDPEKVKKTVTMEGSVIPLAEKNQ